MAPAARRGPAGLLAVLSTGLLVCTAGAPAPEAASARASAPEAAPTPAGGPLLWRAVAPSGGVVYLLGSVHVARERIDDFGAPIVAAWEAADELVVEVDVTALSAEERAALSAYRALEAPATLRDMVSAEVWEELTAYGEARGIEEASFSRWKPWYVYMWIAIRELQRAGYRVDRGVDHVFLAAAAGTKPISSLETADAQFQAYDRVPLELQGLILLDALRRVESVPRDAAALIETWSSGEEERLRKQVFRPLEEMPELRDYYEILFFERNRNMAARLARLAGDGRTRFVVVGAGHMVGEQSIPTLLAERGWPVARVSGKP